MARQQHTAEPWERRGQSLYQEDDGTPGKAKYIAEFKSSDDAARALACVNACAGIPIEALESGHPGWIAALARVLHDNDAVSFHATGGEVAVAIEDALAKLRGET